MELAFLTTAKEFASTITCVNSRSAVETEYSKKSKSLCNKSIRYITMHLYTCFQNQILYIPNNNPRIRLPRVRQERGIKIYFHKRPNQRLPSHLRNPHTKP
ncbi:hypothetical protein V6Z11_D02G225400 [Gossypium hirsutum]|uniref:Uncharacterized protein n=1 Tax=Gossypium tomentosum TaxID=34277 RepID=A0A5D2M1B8_GOSTO|nr:hypothetical protein ES332_D02G241500v1 [Gossypium tomentosum]